MLLPTHAQQNGVKHDTLSSQLIVAKEKKKKENYRVTGLQIKPSVNVCDC
jgi:hypothetical protein